MPDSSLPTAVPLNQAICVWIRVAIYSFGGPAGQIAVMHRLLVEEKRWISENRFLHALNYAMLLPGPEAQQLAIYIGWLLNGTVGGLIAGTLFVVPGFLSILGLSVLYAGYQGLGVVQAIFFGLKPAVMAIVAEAVWRIGRRALRNTALVGVAAVAFVAIFFLNVPFPLIVLGAAVLGAVGGHFYPPLFGIQPAAAGEAASVVDDAAVAVRPTLGRAMRVLAIGLALWWGPLVWIAAAQGPDTVWMQIGLLFSKTAVVTFGGAYAVLAYIAQEAVHTYGWLQPSEMLDGLGMAETTPGPLIQVVQFVGFMGAYRHAGGMSPLWAGVLGSVLTTWVTFVPCFLWIFLGAPYIEYLRGQKLLTAALSGITAAVVGVILNLAVWFGLHTLFTQVDELWWGPVRVWWPVWRTLDTAALFIALVAFVGLFQFKWSMFVLLGVSIVLGVLLHSWPIF